MAFCPHCGASLKGATPGQPAPASLIANKKKPKRTRKQEKNQNPEKGEKQEKSEHGFIGFLIGGLILITIGVFSLLQLSNYFNQPGQGLAVMLFIIGIIIIIAAVYVALSSRKHFPTPSTST